MHPVTWDAWTFKEGNPGPENLTYLSGSQQQLRYTPSPTSGVHLLSLWDVINAQVTVTQGSCSSGFEKEHFILRARTLEDLPRRVQRTQLHRQEQRLAQTCQEIWHLYDPHLLTRSRGVSTKGPA